jgi:hypothetical protein
MDSRQWRERAVLNFFNALTKRSERVGMVSMKGQFSSCKGWLFAYLPKWQDRQSLSTSFLGDFAFSLVNKANNE